MQPALILLTSTGLLAITAVGGLVMAGIRFAANRQPPPALAMLHGFLAAAAVTLLLYGAATVGLPAMALVALLLFLVAAGGGVILNLNYHWKQLPLPEWLVARDHRSRGIRVVVCGDLGDTQRVVRDSVA